MADRYQQLINTPIGRIVSKQVGLPSPRQARALPARPAGDRRAGAARRRPRLGARRPDGRRSSSAIGADVVPAGESFKALVFDATGIASSEQLREAWSFFHPTIRQVRDSGRVIVLGTPPEVCEDPVEAVAQRALEGLVRSIGKEVRHGATAQLVYVRPGAEAEIESTLRFFLSPKSAYVSGQVVRIGDARGGGRARSTGSNRWPARWRSSPAPRAGSARRSPRCSRATAPTSSASTSPRRPTS